MKNEQPVSVILPIYNVEKYLERCIKSIAAQTYTNLEILLIDDGSTDLSADICDMWAEKDKRVIAIHKKNEGLGMARNTGIDNATGRYVFFVDSDDYVAPDMIEKVVKLAEKTNSDVVCYGSFSVRADGGIRSVSVPQTKKALYAGNEIREDFLADLIGPDSVTGEKTYLTMSAWATMVSRQFIEENNWRFVSEREYISEDVYSLLNLYKFARRVAVLPEALYYYCENSGSLTQTFNKKRYGRIIRFYYDALSLCEGLGYSEKVKKRIDYTLISNTIGTLKILCKSDLKLSDKKKEFKKIAGNRDLQAVLSRNHHFKADSAARRTLIYFIKLRAFTISYFLVDLQTKKH